MTNFIRGCSQGRHGGDGVRQILVELRLEAGLVIPQVELRRRTVHVEINEALGGGLVMRQFWNRGMNFRPVVVRGDRVRKPRRCHAGECDGAGANTGARKELAAGLLSEEFLEGIHGMKVKG